MAIETTLPNPNDPNTDIYHTATQESVFLREALRRIRTLPGVEETAVSDRAGLPLGHGQSDRRQRPLIREGVDVQSSEPPLIDSSIVSPEYFPSNNSQSLGEEPIFSSEPERFTLKSSGVSDVMKFAIPLHSKLQRFDKIQVVFLPDARRREQSAKIAVKEFQLIPR